MIRIIVGFIVLFERDRACGCVDDKGTAGKWTMLRNVPSESVVKIELETNDINKCEAEL